MFESGLLDDTRQLIDLYLEEIIVYKEHVNIGVNVLPFFPDEIELLSQSFLPRGLSEMRSLLLG